MESSILFEVEKLCEKLLLDVNHPIDLNFRLNLSVVNVLWFILVGQRLDLDDQRLLGVVHAIDRVLKSAEVSSLLAVLWPQLFKLVHPRFKAAKETFEDARFEE